jgi:hypothetical protein
MTQPMYALPILIVLLLVILLYTSVTQAAIVDVDAIVTTESAFKSPSFRNQEILDPLRDWIDLRTKTLTTQGDRSTDIESVDYYSDKNILNATLWLFFPFQVNQFHLNEEVNYGMYIDADFNENTGFEGIEYKVELNWNNRSKTWNKLLEKWSHFGEIIVLYNKTIPYANFTKQDAHYVLLSQDLGDMLSPEKYKILFYAEARREGSLITDFTKWIAVPSPQLDISSPQNFITMRPGEAKTIQLNLTATSGFEPIVRLAPLVRDEQMGPNIKLNPPYIPMPSFGKATSSVTITAPSDSTTRQYWVPITGDVSFEFRPPTSSRLGQFSEINFLPESVSPQNSSFVYTLIVSVEPPTLNDNLNQIREELTVLWEKNVNIIIVIIGIFLTPFGAWAFDKLIKKERKKREKSKDSIGATSA